MRKWLLGMIAAMILVTAPAFFMQVHSAAEAASSCDEVVVDDAGAFGSRFSDVVNEAQKLESLSADVRVRTVKTFGSAGTLDVFERQLEAECASWRSPDGKRKNNLIVLMMALDERKSGIYYGSEFTRPLESQWQRVKADIMDARFKEGALARLERDKEDKFAAGFINGLREITRLVDAHLHPPVAAPSGPVVVVQQPKESSPPPDFSGVGTFFMWLLVAGVIGGVGFAGFSVVSGYRREQEARRAAQQKARLARQGAAARINELTGELPLTAAKVDVITGQVSDTDAKSLREQFAALERLLRGASEEYANLGHSAGDPDRPGLSESEYDAIASAYRTVLDRLMEANAHAERLAQELKALEEISARTPEALVAASAVVAKARTDIEEVRGQGFKTDAHDGALVKAESVLAEAHAVLGKKRFGEAMTRAQSAQDAALQAAEHAKRLPAGKHELDAELERLASRLTEATDAIAAGKITFDAISSAYAPSSWDSIRGNGTEATKRVNKSATLLEQAKTAVSMEQQDWDGARKHIANTQELLDHAASYMRSVEALAANLAAAKRDAAGEIQAAAADIKIAWDYIHRYDDDIREGLENDLSGAEKKLTTATVELAASLPDYIAVVKIAREVHASADKILAEAHSEHETADRLRAKEQSLMRDAQREISQAREYIEDHRSDVGRAARSTLDDAARHWGGVAAATTLADRVAMLEKAEATAERSYLRARRDFEEAEAERRRVYEAEQRRIREEQRLRDEERRREQEHEEEQRRARSFDFGGRDSGGGGSSSWGSSGGDGGGGSSGFDSGGGGGDGGGGSSGW